MRKLITSWKNRGKQIAAVLRSLLTRQPAIKGPTLRARQLKAIVLDLLLGRKLKGVCVSRTVLGSSLQELRTEISLAHSDGIGLVIRITQFDPGTQEWREIQMLGIWPSIDETANVSSQFETLVFELKPEIHSSQSVMRY